MPGIPIVMYDGTVLRTPELGKGMYIQGLQYILTQNNSSLLQNFESERLQKPTGGSPDVVHLIKYASLVFG